jgi:hypothetical protein
MNIQSISLQQKILTLLMNNQNIENIDFVIHLSEKEKLSVIKYALVLENISFIKKIEKHINLSEENLKDFIFYAIENKSKLILNHFDNKIDLLMTENNFIISYCLKAIDFSNQYAIDKIMSKTFLNLDDYPIIIGKYEKNKPMIDYFFQYQKQPMTKFMKSIEFASMSNNTKNELGQKIKLINQKIILDLELKKKQKSKSFIKV